MPDPITRFRGPYSFLSNFHLCNVSLDKRIWPSAEHAFQQCKCLFEYDKARILRQPIPYEARKIGRYSAMVDGWERKKRAEMLRVLQAKFTQNRVLAERLIATGDAELIEGNDWGDSYWGVFRGKGENELGKILMRVRKELIEKSSAGKE